MVQKSVIRNQREKGVEKAHMSRIINDGEKKNQLLNKKNVVGKEILKVLNYIQ